VKPSSLPALDQNRARAIAAEFSAASVLVIGDVMLDQFLLGRVTRISPEAPVPIVHYARSENRIGGAANVAHNVGALGGKAALVGLIGRDASASALRDALSGSGLPTDGLVEDTHRPTTTKVRVVTDRHQQVARVDYEDDREAAGSVETALVECASRLAAHAGVIVVSDYLKGCVTRRLVGELVVLAKQQSIPLLVDPKIPHIDYYRGASLVTPNHHEAEVATHTRIRTDEEAAIAARRFRERAGCEGVLITRGEHGMWLLDGDVEGVLPATARDVADVTGAGDTVIATLALALAAGATLAEAARLANHAAGLVVAKFGPATVSVEELLEVV
jgi:rfaE bifunctional protein kinase chain/domain